MRKSQKSAVVAGTVVAITGVSIAFAAWTTNGTGTGTATAGTSKDLTVSGVTADELYPTITVDSVVTVSNPNSYAVELSSLTPGAVTSDVEDCNATSVSGAALTGLTDRIAAGGSVDKTVEITMSNMANDDCKNAVFTIAYAATSNSAA